MHIPDIDFGTSVLTLVDGLKEVRDWSLAHPRHVPIFILIELKDETLGPSTRRRCRGAQRHWRNWSEKFCRFFRAAKF